MISRARIRYILVLSLPLLLVFPQYCYAGISGEILYEQHCASCHGDKGQGGVGVPLNLQGFQQNITDDYLHTTIRVGRPGRVMPSFSELSTLQVNAIVSHVRSFVPGKYASTSNITINGNAQHGKKLFSQHCAACHGNEGKGGQGTGVTQSRPRDAVIAAPALNNRGFLFSATDTIIRDALLHGRKGTAMKSFVEKGLSLTDISDLVSYVRSFQEPYLKQEKRTIHEKESVLIAESPYDMETTLRNVTAAAKAANYRIIRTQKFDQGIVDVVNESDDEIIVYFCNFERLNDVLAIDPRVGAFLPCRVTLVRRNGKVKIMSINPKHLSPLFNNHALDQACEKMYNIYVSILEEATL